MSDPVAIHAVPPVPPCGALLRDAGSGGWLLYRDPVEVHAAHRLSEVSGVLEKACRLAHEGGMHAAGFVSYEAGPAFDGAVRCRPDDSGFPLAWFGIYARPESVPPPSASQPGMNGTIQWQPSVSPEEYRDCIAAVRRLIAAGDTYQVNYSFRLRAPAPADPWALFVQMAAAHGAGFAAYLRIPGWTVCSASPELFFSMDGDRVVSRPMKGTAPRGLWREDDLRRARDLRASEKERAENVMVTDMVRSDLGRIAKPGTVSVDELFTVEQYPTVWQMTSSVSCRTRAGVGGVFGALFPPASVTGAPKVRTSAIIADVEREPRRIYTGAIGCIAPARRAGFSVAIRTVLVDEARGTAEYGVGSGIVWDSVDGAELGECMEKARVLGGAPPEFRLLEALRWSPAGGYDLLGRHMERLAGSAAHFGWDIDAEEARALLEAKAAGFPQDALKVRLAVARDGAMEVSTEPLTRAKTVRRVGIARAPVDSGDVFLYHKTTLRAAYDSAAAARPDCDDVILWNSRGEATESCRANLVVELDGRLFTPPVECGLLAGTLRAGLLARGEIAERVIPLCDLRRCNRILLANSVRGAWEVELDPADHQSLALARPSRP